MVCSAFQIVKGVRGEFGVFLEPRASHLKLSLAPEVDKRCTRTKEYSG